MILDSILAINISSNALPAASNFCVRCLGSPTKAEFDGAHALDKDLHWISSG